MKLQFVDENEVVTATVLREYLCEGTTVFLCYRDVVIDNPINDNLGNKQSTQRQTYLVPLSKKNNTDFFIDDSDFMDHEMLKINAKKLLEITKENPKNYGGDIAKILNEIHKIVNP